VVGGSIHSIPTVFGQNTSPNTTTTSDIVDLFGNVTDREEGGADQEEDDDDNNSIFPQLNDVDGSNKDNGNDNSSSSSASIPSTSPSPS